MSWQDILPLCHSCTPIAHWVGADSSTLRGLGLHFRIHWCSSCRLFEQVLRTAWYSVVIQLLYCRGRLFCRCRTALYSVVTQPLHCRGRLFCSVPLLYTHSSLGGCRPFDTQRPQAALGCRCAGCSATVPRCMARGVMGSCRLFDSQGFWATVCYCRCRLLCRCALNYAWPTDHLRSGFADSWTLRRFRPHWCSTSDSRSVALGCIVVRGHPAIALSLRAILRCRMVELQPLRLSAKKCGHQERRKTQV